MIKVETLKKSGPAVAGTTALALVFWCLAQFPSQREHDQLKEQVKENHELLSEIHVEVMVQKAIREGAQAEARALYE